MTENTKVNARLISGWQFAVEDEAGRSVTLDGAHPAEGQSTYFSPMEMLLGSLAGCTGTSVISVLQKMRQNISAYELHISGIRAETHPKVFLEIAIEHVFTGHSIKPESVERSIELSETRYCGVSAMLSKTAKITNTYRIIEARE